MIVIIFGSWPSPLFFVIYFGVRPIAGLLEGVGPFMNLRVEFFGRGYPILSLNEDVPPVYRVRRKGYFIGRKIVGGNFRMHDLSMREPLFPSFNIKWDMSLLALSVDSRNPTRGNRVRDFTDHDPI